MNLVKISVYLLMSQKPELFLHIGTENTGTTALQDYLRINVKGYLKRNVVIPDFLGWNNHSILPCVLYRDSQIDELTLTHGLNEKNARNQKRIEIIDSLARLARKNPSSKFIITSEHFQSRLTSGDQILALYNELNPLFSLIKIVLYVCKPIELAVSRLSTQIKWNSVTVCDLPSPSRPDVRQICAHRETVKLWSEVFGDSNLMVRLYRKDYIIQGDIIKDFCFSTGIGMGLKFKLQRLSNPRLNRDGMLLLARANSILPRFSNNSLDERHDGLIQYFESHFNEEPFYSYTPKEEKLYEDYFKGSDEYIRSKYFNHLKSIWGQKSSRFASLTKFRSSLGGFLLRLFYTLRRKVERKINSKSALSGKVYENMLAMFMNAWVDNREEVLRLKYIIKEKDVEILRLKDDISRVKISNE